ncbi:MAG: hypothetical protein ABR502_11020, partial [Chitinophagaceae bacterium]
MLLVLTQRPSCTQCKARRRCWEIKHIKGEDLLASVVHENNTNNAVIKLMSLENNNKSSAITSKIDYQNIIYWILSLIGIGIILFVLIHVAVTDTIMVSVVIEKIIVYSALFLVFGSFLIGKIFKNLTVAGIIGFLALLVIIASQFIESNARTAYVIKSRNNYRKLYCFTNTVNYTFETGERKSFQFSKNLIINDSDKWLVIESVEYNMMPSIRPHYNKRVTHEI